MPFLNTQYFKRGLKTTVLAKVLMNIMVVFLFSAVVSCKETESVQIERTAPEVTVSQPVMQSIKQYAIFTGTTRAIESADIVARVAGRLESVMFKPSSEVKKGDLLFVIEKDKYLVDKAIKKASLESARAQLELAETEVKRMEQALKNRAVSEIDVEKSRASRDVAIASAKSAKAALSESELTLSYTDVVSTIDGVVSRELVDAGNLVGQEGPTLLTTVNKMQPAYVYFNVPESLMLRFLEPIEKNRHDHNGVTSEAAEERRASHPAYVERANETGFPHQGIVDYIDNEVNKNTGTIEMRIRLENKESAFFPGLFVRIKLPAAVEIDNAVLIKEVALGSDLGGKYVLVVGDDNIVELRYVTLGLPQQNGFVHVLTGLEGNETYIVNGLLRARLGMPVQTKQAESSDMVAKESDS
jgi:RND family efflux transporter MFP subunit